MIGEVAERVVLSYDHNYLQILMFGEVFNSWTRALTLSPHGVLDLCGATHVLFHCSLYVGNIFSHLSYNPNWT